MKIYAVDYSIFFFTMVSMVSLCLCENKNFIRIGKYSLDCEVLFENKKKKHKKENGFMGDYMKKFIKEDTNQIDNTTIKNLLKEIKKYSHVKNIFLYKNRFGKLKMKIFLRKSIAKIETKNSTYLLDEDGVVFSFPSNFQIDGESNTIIKTNFYCDKDKVDNGLLSLVLFIIDSNSFKREKIVLFFLEKKELLLDISRKITVIFGDYHTVNEKITKFKVFLKKILKNDLLDSKYKKVDLTFSNQIICE